MTEPYRRLAQYLDKLPAGYPATDNGVEIRILQHLFSEQEAELAIHLTLLDESARVVAFRARQPESRVAPMLEEMARKGLINARHPAGEVPVYSGNQFVVGFWEDQVNRLDVPLVKLFEEYAPIYFEKGPWKHLPQIRTIPINEAIQITSEVMPYDQVETILRSKKKIAVRNCVCRQERHVVGKGCDKPIETCLSFDGAARNTVESGKGRFISLNEALSIVEKAQKAGLVLQPANSQNPIFLCACCGCCCGVLRHIKADPNPASLVANPYHAEHDPEICTACGLCLEVCPMEALTLATDGSIAFDQLRCIGCGLCVGVCPEGAVKLVRKAAALIAVPPRNVVGTYLKLAVKRKSWTIFDMAGLVIKSFMDRLIAPRK